MRWRGLLTPSLHCEAVGALEFEVDEGALRASSADAVGHAPRGQKFAPCSSTAPTVAMT
jgi:hypothetical protein